MDSTPFELIYNRFFGKVTDDMYLEITPTETEELLSELLISAIQWFEFPRVDLSLYDVELEEFQSKLSDEEINILATYMVTEWLVQQIATIENTRLKYSGSDFKFTSQANHAKTLNVLRKEFERQGFHLQRLYKRKYVDEDGVKKPSMGILMKPTRDIK